MAHNYTRLFYHFVWATWDRTPLLTGEVEARAYALIRHQCAEQVCQVHALGGVEDHVHLLVSLPTTLNVADFIKSVKGASSRALNAGTQRGHSTRASGGPHGVSSGRAATASSPSARPTSA